MYFIWGHESLFNDKIKDIQSVNVDSSGSITCILRTIDRTLHVADMCNSDKKRSAAKKQFHNLLRCNSETFDMNSRVMILSLSTSRGRSSMIKSSYKLDSTFTYSSVSPKSFISPFPSIYIMSSNPRMSIKRPSLYYTYHPLFCAYKTCASFM